MKYIKLFEEHNHEDLSQLRREYETMTAEDLGELLVDEDDVRKVQLLIDCGADVDIIGTFGLGLTPLQRAAMHGRRGVVKLSVDAGADVELEGPNGSTALHYGSINVKQRISTCKT